MSNDTKLQKLFDNLEKVNFKKRIKIRHKSNRTDSYSLYFDIWRNGKREYRFLKYYLFPGKPFENEKTIQEVIALRDKEELELTRLDNDFTLTNWRKKSNFVTYFESISKDKDSTWKSTLNHLKAFTNSNIAFQNVDEKFIEDFQNYLNTLCRPNSVWLYMSKLRTVLIKAIRDKIITYNPCNSVKTSKQTTHREFLTLDEITLLSETQCQSEVVKDAFLFSCYTGLRISDLFILEWGNILNGYISINQKKTKEPVRVPLHNEALKILDRQDQSHSKIFWKLPCHDYVNVIVNRWLLDSGITKHITFHCARHSFATLCLTSDVDLFTVSKLLGHSNISTTQIYAKLIDKKKDEAINRLPDFSTGNK